MPKLVLKPDMEEAQQRLRLWWEHERTDRPVVWYSHPNPAVPRPPFYDGLFLAKHHDAFEDACVKYEAWAGGEFFGAECTPYMNPMYGPGIMAAVFGCEPRVMSETVWFDRPTSVADIVPLLESARIDMNNPWYARLVRVTEYAASRSHRLGKPYAVALTDIGGVLDVLSSFLGPKELLLALFRRPGVVDTCRAIILEKITRVLGDLAAILRHYGLGYTNWLGVWCPDMWYNIQSDFCAMLSPKLFRRFVLPDMRAQASHMPRSLYHLDGPGEVPFVDDLIAIPELTGIQWSPGIQTADGADDQWFPMYRKIQAAGKNLYIYGPGNETAKFYKLLDPRGLMVNCGFGSKIWADFYLPKFLGGMEGVDPDE